MPAQFSPSALHHLRLARGLTTTKLAAAVDRTADAIEGYECGRFQPSVSVLASLADALDVTPNDLFESVPESVA